MSKQKIMEDLDALLADLKVSVPVQQALSQQTQQAPSQQTVEDESSVPGGITTTLPTRFMAGSVVQPVSTQLVNGGPVAVSSHMTSLSSNLLELDSLLDELDAVELSDDVVRHLGVDPSNNNVEKYPPQFQDNSSTYRQTTVRALSATQELDELMGSLTETKVLFRLSNEATSTTSHTSDVSADSGRVSPPSLSLSASKQNATDLSVLLDAIDLNLAEQGVVVQPKGLCAACSKPIIGRMVTAVGKLWHPEHFVCSRCGESLSSCNYFERNLQPFCERDYHLIFSPKCEACAGPILDKCVMAVGRTWHPEHFCCTLCRRQLTENDDFHEKDGVILCRDDYMKRFAPPCFRCLLPILDDHMSAFGHDWHQQCFVCHDCGACLESGHCYEGSDGKPYCERHIVCEGRSPQCAGCGGPILGRCVSAMSRRYHVEHFVCTFCRQPLFRCAFKEFEGRPYCRPCFVRLGGR